MTRWDPRTAIVVLILLTAGHAGRPALGQQHEHGHGEADATDHHAHATTRPALATPQATRVEHEHLHERLDAALAAGGQTAERARAVADVLSRHFEEEEAYAMPPLGLLPALAAGQELPDEQVERAIEMADRLRANYPRMLEEHAELRRALEALAATARAEDKVEYAEFADTLLLHAGHEEQVLYPTTLLIGEYLKLRRGASAPGAGAHDVKR